MASRVEFTTEAEVGIQTLWNGITKDKFTVLGKAAPSMLQDFQVLEGDGGSGTIFYVTLGPGESLCNVLTIEERSFVSFISLKSTCFVFSFLHKVAKHVPPFKEKFVDLDETEHLASFQTVEGGFLELGFASYVVSLKLDYIGDNRTLVKVVITYDLVKDLEDGTALVDGLTNMVSEYLKIVFNALQEATV
ncbi:hypothetical protein HPP92_000783 [Vanilla planifolia]|uniref:Bet v I/Major latex protein domain-containing protein n=1 Tax=Vanilla planifolia TaxID=51239 RepID=A0A835VL96_VANPL|nr:hypothetical protein HPP92_000783 [Vanilla planifolia]